MSGRPLFWESTEGWGFLDLTATHNCLNCFENGRDSKCNYCGVFDRDFRGFHTIPCQCNLVSECPLLQLTDVHYYQSD